MELIPRLSEAVRLIQSKSPLRPQIGLVLGSGLGAFAKSLDKAATIPYGQIPHWPVSTAIGHAGELFVGQSQGVPLAVLSGRAHLYEGYTPEQVVFPVRVLGRMGVKVVIFTNAAGSVNVNYHPGELMIVTDHINLMGSNPMVGRNEDALGQRFFDMTEAYDPLLAGLAEKASAKVGMTVRRGVYIAVLGPSYETPAEIKMARTLGADAIGMSTVPEVIAARHMGMRVLAISCITNMAAGVLKKKLDHREVLDTAEKVREGLTEMLQRLIVDVAKQA